MSYQPMPAAPPPGPTASKGAPPAPVLLAVRLMFTNAALGVLGVLALLLMKSTLRDQIRDSNAGKSAADIDDLVNAAIVIALVIGLVFLVLYVLLALQVRKGKNWARITTWVFAGLGVLSALSSAARTAPALSKVLSVIGGVLDVVIIVLLARQVSNDYFRSRPPNSYYPPQT